MMELDEAIKHAEEIAEESEKDAKSWVCDGWQSGFKKLTPEKEAEFYAERVKLSDNCAKCAEEHRQLAEWLKELKELREKQRPHGEWYTTPNPNHSPFDSTSEVIYMCSKCAYSSGERITATWQFCPNCGADMRKEGDENER